MDPEALKVAALTSEESKIEGPGLMVAEVGVGAAAAAAERLAGAGAVLGREPGILYATRVNPALERYGTQYFTLHDGKYVHGTRLKTLCTSGALTTTTTRTVMINNYPC